MIVEGLIVLLAVIATVAFFDVISELYERTPLGRFVEWLFSLGSDR